MLPPVRGGLADHTVRLAQSLSRQFSVTVLSSRDVYPGDTYAVRGAVHNWDDTEELVIELSATPKDTLLVWQYVPHMYGRGGVNRQLPQLWQALEDEGRRQVILAHEIEAPWGTRPNHWWYAWNHRRQWRAALKVADLLPISTEAWLLDWQKREPAQAEKMFTLPSPSNILPVPVPADHRVRWRQSHNLPEDAKVMLWWGSVSTHKQLLWVLEAWETACRRLGPVALCVAGANPAIPIPGSLRPWAKLLGYQNGEEISKCLHAADLLALPFIDGVSERRSTFMAGLAHGVPVVTTTGHNTGPTIRQANWLVTSPVSQREAFIENVVTLLGDESRRRTVGAAGQAWHDAHYTWDVVTRMLVERMQGVGILDA
jgi:glycosyltransferase involved in cell wall biosynthesis